MVDATDSKSVGEIRASSSLARGTNDLQDFSAKRKDMCVVQSWHCAALVRRKMASSLRFAGPVDVLSRFGRRE